MKIGAIGDVHAEDGALAAALAVLAHERADVILAVGDIVDGPGDVDRCVALLVEAGALAVRGNHDRWLVEDKHRALGTQPGDLSAATRAFLAALPSTRTLATPRGALVLCHGVGDDDMARLHADTAPDDLLHGADELDALLADPDVAVVVGGHTHRRLVRRLARPDGAPALLWLNPGTLKRDDDPCFALFDLERGVARFWDLLDGRPVFASEGAL